LPTKTGAPGTVEKIVLLRVVATHRFPCKLSEVGDRPAELAGIDV